MNYYTFEAECAHLWLGETGHFGLHPRAPIKIKVVLNRDAQSEKVKKLEDEFLAQHLKFAAPETDWKTVD